MNKIYIPKGYKPVLDAYDTQRAIAYIKQNFQEEFASALNLKRVSAPLFVTENSGLNDNLSGVERPVSFDIPAVGADAQVVHSLAKWKRLALKRYGFGIGGGLYTDIYEGQMVEEFENWCFDTSRQYGDTGLVRTTYGYHIMYFVSAQDVWVANVREAMIYEASLEIVNSAAEKWPADIDYKKIVLGDISTETAQ